MLHSTYDDQYFTKHHYKYKIETTAEIEHNHLQNLQSIYDDRFSL